jgi:Lon protease-like protein
MQIPLFPLHAVLCPGIALPLHIFEPRYRVMTERCIEEETPFGIVLIREGREVGGATLALSGVGTLAAIRQAGRLPDGRYDILVVGTTRFAIEDVDTEQEPYLVGKVDLLAEDVGDEDRATALSARTMRRFVTYLRLLQPREGETGEDIDVRVEVETEEPEEAESGGIEPPAELEIEPEDPGDPDPGAPRPSRRVVIPDDPTVLSYLLSGILQVELPRRQALLEAETTEERLQMLDGLLDRELTLLRRRLRLFAPTAAALPQPRD